MRRARGHDMEPATRNCHPGSGRAGDNASSRAKSEKTKTDDKTTRRCKLRVRIHVGDLRDAIFDMEQKLSGLKRKYETLNANGEQRCVKRAPKSLLKAEPIKGEADEIDVPEIEADEKDIVPEKDVGFVPLKPLSRLPVLDKKFEEKPRVTTDILTKVVGLETLYGVLMEEHLGVQLQLQDCQRRLRVEERRSRQLEERRNPINLALAERIGQLQAELESTRRTLADLREENDHLEFRLLEMDEPPIRKTVLRSAESTRYDPGTDVDDVSDSGVMSLPASDDEHTDFSLETRVGECDVKGRLLSLSQNSAVGDRICIQQGLALLRHYEARVEALESTIAAMCHEATLGRGGGGQEGGRIIATVLPFSERRDLQESGIWEEAEAASRGTQTEPTAGGELGTELEKLSRIREQLEVPPGKQLAYYRTRVETLEARLELYQAGKDERNRLLSARLEKEARLEADLARATDRIAKLQAENARLEEERCELEEAENDTRLRCQKLEFKLSALGEKKNCLKAQLEQLSHEMAAREEERKKATHMEAIVQNYEKKNQELEEQELQLRYRLQMLENTMPALMMWNMWRMMVTMQGQNPALQGILPPAGVQPGVRKNGQKEEELVLRLQALESRLEAENRMLQESKNAEEMLRNKVRDLEQVLDSKDNNILHILDRDPGEDIEAFEKLSKMAKERVEMDRRIKDLELKEKMYQETLQQVDVMFTDMEGNYSKQLQEKDEQLYEKDNKLAETEFKLKQSAQVSEMNLQLQERLSQLEMEMKNLTEALKKREMEREALENEEKKLNDELQECLQELDTLKKQIEGPMKGQLEVQRKKTAALEDQLEKEQCERLDMEAEHQNEVALLEKKIDQLTKELLENEVTIGELREEVQTLESAIDDLRCHASLQKAEKEELKKAYEAKIEEKERLFEDLKDSMSSKSPGRSLKDELEEMMGGQPGFGRDIAPRMEGDQSPLPLITDSDGDYCRHMTEFGQPKPKEAQEICDESKKTVYNKMTDIKLNDWKSKTARVIEDLIKEIDRGEPHVDTASTKGTPSDIPPDYHPVSPECRTAQQAVSSLSDKEITGTYENITGVFQHSKICKSCTETLGSYLGDLIKELVMRTPGTSVLGNRQL